MPRIEKGYRQHTRGKTPKPSAVRIEDGGDLDSSAEFNKLKRQASKRVERSKGKAG